MIGKWNGHYQYENKNLQKALGFERTFFQINISKFDGKKFTGTVADDLGSGGTEGIGVIEGELIDGDIRFVKKMPVQTIRNPFTGERTTSNKPHPPIFYKGRRSYDGKYMS